MSQVEQFHYDNKIVKKFAYATMLWSIVGMLVGLIIALQLVFPSLNLDTPWLTFSRLRPLHTNAVIFAFVGNGIFMGVYYSLQRLMKARMFSDLLSNLHFWGWQLIIVSAAATLPFGFTTSGEYAELTWPIDIAITLVWVIFGINMFGTILKRREEHLYVAVWFYIATWITVALLHIVRNLELPTSGLHSYGIFAGVQEALVQWWYGHNAVAFFLTTPYLGLMYYFMPKAANRPVYSYRLSIVHFWALIFIYIWAGPHHLLYTSLPDWAQSLGMVFSLMLIAPSWGGMINGLLTLRGAWDRVREDPILKFMVVAVTAYGMSTFEGPMMSIKSFNAVTHYTDWTIAHVHVGALGWNGMLTFGVLYWLLPRIFNTKLYSTNLANIHFWLATLGIIFYAIPLYWGGVTQFLMWRDFTPDGFLVYPNFLETVTQIIPMYAIRALGGAIYLTGVIIGVYNLLKTTGGATCTDNEYAEAPAFPKNHVSPAGNKHWHSWIERRPMQMLVGSLVMVLIGGMVELFPMWWIDDNVPKIESVTPYTPLELQGRDLYVREGCVGCHSQMIRPFRFETERYGDYSKSGEFVYDRPFLWGSKRTGPDLAREGTGKLKKSDSWHYNHMIDPTSTSPGSIMPAYPWMAEDDLDISTTAAKISVLRKLGTPYDTGYEEIANEDLAKQAAGIAKRLKEEGVDQPGVEKKEIVAMIAYLQRLGVDITLEAQVEK
ncbi:MAG: cytochrome-c oxidase, cbb3-type subunit I [Saprospiraceae bacterium]|nr:cytochrome-c oxidase, cbb3-type subunit I [Saprospiraceae bacterium]